MKKSILMGLGVCALALGGVAALVGQRDAAETKADGVTDSSIEIRFTLPDGWGDYGVGLHTFDEGGKPSTDWPGYTMTYLWTNNYSQKVYSWRPSLGEPLYDKIIFNNRNNGEQSAELTAPDVSTGFYLDGSWKSFEITYETRTIYLYDYAGSLSKTPYARGYQNDTHDVSPGVEMTPEITLSGNGRVYSATVKTDWDAFDFYDSEGNELFKATGHPADNYCYVYGTLEGGNSWWNNINYVYAHNWAMNIMKMNSIDPEDLGTHVSTVDCAANYSAAKSVYKQFNTFIKTEISTSFADAKVRFGYWVAANGDSFDPSTNVLTENPAPGAKGIIEMSSSNDVALISGVITVGALLSVGGLFLLRKRKAE